MCSHFNGTPINEVTDKNYIAQWNSVIDGTAIEKENFKFDLNDYPVLCLYNLGSLFNKNEISHNAIQYIFKSLNDYKGKCLIIHSIDDKNYPEFDNNDHGISSWFRVEIYDFYYTSLTLFCQVFFKIFLKNCDKYKTK